MTEGSRSRDQRANPAGSSDEFQGPSSAEEADRALGIAECDKYPRVGFP